MGHHHIVTTHSIITAIWYVNMPFHCEQFISRSSIAFCQPLRQTGLFRSICERSISMWANALQRQPQSRHMLEWRL